jgi:hypothetical protein
MDYKPKLYHYRNGFYRDRRTDILNEIIDRVILPDVGDALLDFLVIREMGKCEYEMVVLTKRFNSHNVLFNEIYHLVEDLLMWYDISEFGNFKIRIEGDGNNRPLTYFDLLGWVLSYSRGIRGGPNHTHRRYNEVVEHMNEKMRQERHEYNEKMKLALGGGRLFYENTDPIVIPKPEKKSFIRKVKDYFLNLWYV